jgi:hypothetical protein
VAIVFLCSERAGWISGTALSVDAVSRFHHVSL